MPRGFLIIKKGESFDGSRITSIREIGTSALFLCMIFSPHGHFFRIVFFEKRKRRSKAIGNGRAERRKLFFTRQAYRQFFRVEHEASFGKNIVFFSVNRISQNRTADVFHVYPYLMRAPRFETKAHKRIVSVRGDAAVNRPSALSVFRLSRGFKTLSVFRIADDLRFDVACESGRPSLYDRDVFFLHEAAGTAVRATLRRPCFLP